MPFIPAAETPETDSQGNYVGWSNCQALYPTQRPPVPYGDQSNVDNTLYFEEGFKEVVGSLTEGRYLVLEKSGSALTNNARKDLLTATSATALHDSKSQRWVIHYTSNEESGIFTMSSALDGHWLGPAGTLVAQPANAAQVRISFLGNGHGYTLQYVSTGEYIDIGAKGDLKMDSAQQAPSQGFTIFSVSYHN